MPTQQIKGSKRYRQAAEMVDLTKDYTLADASALLNTLPKAKFDETVEVAVRLGVNPRQADQMVRGAVSLPYGTGKSVRVVVFADASWANEALRSSQLAVIVGLAEETGSPRTAVARSSAALGRDRRIFST